jgi:hypothetical protein
MKMRKLSRFIALVVLIVAASLILSGCLLRQMFAFVGPTPDGAGLTITVHTEANVATCWRVLDDDGNRVGYDCTYWLIDENGFLFVVSTAELISEHGLVGVVVDPLILQVPEGVHLDDVTATFRDFEDDFDPAVGPEPQPFDVTIVEAFAADASTTVTAEPGHVFLIIELPDDILDTIPEGGPPPGPDTIPIVPHTRFDFALRIVFDGEEPVEIKPMATLKFDVDDATFYVPMAPCVTDFSEVPGIVFASGPPMSLRETIAELIDELTAGTPEGEQTHVCQGTVYDLDGDGPPPPPPPTGDGVVIDVKPDSDENPINPRSRGVIPVAILSTSDFDAATVDPSMLRFGPDGASIVHPGGYLEDVNGDGLLDLVVHFQTQETGIECGDTSVSLSGSTFDGEIFEATDAIRTVGCR